MRSGWFQRLLVRSDQPAPRLERPRRLKSPAKDDGFDFAVTVSIVWTGPPRMAWATLENHVKHVEPTLWEAIDTVVREQARQYPAHCPGDLERALVGELAQDAQEWQPGPRGVRWRARVRVEQDEQVKGLQQESTMHRVRQQDAVASSHWQVRELRTLLAEWRQFLGDLNVDKPGAALEPMLAPHLARLALHPDEAAQTVAALQEDRLEQQERLFDVLRDAIAAHQKVNTYEFVMSYESALSLLMKHLGTQTPQLGSNGHGERGEGE